MRRRRVRPKHLGLGVNWRDTNRAYFKAVFSPVDTGRESQRAGSVLYICPHVFVLHMLLYICVLILLCMCLHAALGVFMLL